MDGHVGGGVVDQVVHVVPQLPGGRSSSCLKGIHHSHSLNGQLTLRLLNVVLAELCPRLRDTSTDVLLLDSIVVLDVDRVVVHLVAVPVDLQRHVFVLKVPM